MQMATHAARLCLLESRSNTSYTFLTVGLQPKGEVDIARCWLTFLCVCVCSSASQFISAQFWKDERQETDMYQ